MSSLIRRGRRVLALSPRIAARRIATYGTRQLRSIFCRSRDQLYGSHTKRAMHGRIAKLLPSELPVTQGLEGVCTAYLAHQFDLLGSGCVRVGYGMTCRGVEGYRYPIGMRVEPDREGNWLRGRISTSNLGESQRIWRLIFDEECGWALADYCPIDWQLDFKSGYRWSERSWYLDIPFGHRPGVDVKVPWELARMQHLPQMAILVASANGYDAMRDRLAREFRAQILDFIATNPPRYGVNWYCTMDVAIRAVNLLIAYDIFRANNVVFDHGFEFVLHRSIYEHGLHIVENLETAGEKRGNHYLANVVGLLFIAVYLPRSGEADAWLVFAVRELIREVYSQFSPEGTNFENSTCYHRLSAEMVIYATALVIGLPSERQVVLQSDVGHIIAACPRLAAILKAHDEQLPLGELALFPNEYLERLEKMGEFVMHITKPNGRVVQVGDNDSGRFVKLGVAYQSMTVKEATSQYANLHGYQECAAAVGRDTYWQEDHLDHRHIVAALGVLFDRADFVAFAAGSEVESAVLRAYSGNVKFSSCRQANTSRGAESVRVGTIHDWEGALAHFAALPEELTKVIQIRIPGGLGTEPTLFGYPEFGLYVYWTSHVYLAVRCGPAVLEGNGAHAHNDQLSIELNVDGVDWIADPGSYLYTALPHRRNEYRSVKAHFAPRLRNEEEPGSFSQDLFWLEGHPQSRCIYFGKDGFFGVHFGYGQPIYRLVKLNGNAVDIVDWTEGEVLLDMTGPSIIDVPLVSTVPFSPGYGMQLAH